MRLSRKRENVHGMTSTLTAPSALPLAPLLRDELDDRLAAVRSNLVGLALALGEDTLEEVDLAPAGFAYYGARAARLVRDYRALEAAKRARVRK